MLAKYESHKNLRQDKLCPFLVHYGSRAFNAVCNWHPNLEVILVLVGSGCMQYGADTLSVREGDILIINPNVLHRFHKSESMIYHCIIIDEVFCADNGILTDELLFVRHFQDSRTEVLCRDIAENYLCYQFDRTSLKGAKARNAVLSLLIDLCENHLADPKSIYAKETGQTILTYVNLVRCMHAQQRIASGMTVTEAALESGFESVSYFSRTYKKLMGTVPSKEK